MSTQSQIEKLVDDRMIKALERFKISGGSYWQKISKFQVIKDGKTWQITDAFDVGRDYRKCELCGHYPCRHLYVIESLDTHEKLTIGSECVLNYVKDINAREILLRYQKNFTTKIMSVQTSRSNLIKMADWVSKNGPHALLSSFTRQILSGKRLSKNQELILSEILGRTISKEAQEARTQIVQLLTQARQKVRNDWENRFVMSLVEQHNANRLLSEKQLVILRRIANY